MCWGFYVFSTGFAITFPFFDLIIPHGGGHDDKTVVGLEDIKAFLTKAVIKLIVI